MRLKIAELRVRVPPGVRRPEGSSPSGRTRYADQVVGIGSALTNLRDALRRPEAHVEVIDGETVPVGMLLGTLGALLLDAGSSVTDVRSALEKARDSAGVGDGLAIGVLPALVIVSETATGAATIVNAEGIEALVPPVRPREPSRARPGARRDRPRRDTRPGPEHPAGDPAAGPGAVGARQRAHVGRARRGVPLPVVGGPPRARRRSARRGDRSAAAALPRGRGRRPVPRGLLLDGRGGTRGRRHRVRPRPALRGVRPGRGVRAGSPHHERPARGSPPPTS